MLFQLNWNAVPTYPEQESNLAITRRELKKLTTKAYRVENERWRLEVGRVSSWWRLAVERTAKIVPSLYQALREFGIKTMLLWCLLTCARSYTHIKTVEIPICRRLKIYVAGTTIGGSPNLSTHARKRTRPSSPNLARLFSACSTVFWRSSLVLLKNLSA